jgi:NitT/TauT family transport system substrate-binding protein
MFLLLPRDALAHRLESCMSFAFLPRRPPVITLSENFRALFYAPFYAAQATGAYAAEGVNVDIRLASDPDRTAAALRTGEVEVMWGGPLRVLLTHDADPASDVVCFCDVVARDPFFVVGREPRPDFRLSDLTRVRFASVSEVPTPWLCLQDDIRRDGADPETVTRVTDGTMARNAAALRDGKLDAVQVFEPYAEELAASGAGHIWYAAANRGLTAYTTLVTRRSVIEQKRDELLRMVRALRMAVQWIKATPGTEIQRVLAGYFPDMPPEICAGAVDRYRALNLYASDPVIRPEGFARLAACIRSGGALRRDIPFSECIDNRLAEEVLAEG